MIGIQAIASYIPEQKINNVERMERFEIDQEFLENKTGMLNLALKNDDEDTSDLCCKALNALAEKSKINLNDIDCLIVCTQNPDNNGLPHTSAIVHGKLGLSKDCAVFDISLGCSGYIYGLSIIKGFMMLNDYKKGVLITADPYSKIIDKNDKNTSLLFGDAATATLLSNTPLWEIGKFYFGSDGSAHSSIQISSKTKFLEMNGRAVFNFTATVVPANIEKTLKINSIDKDSVDYFILHQGSRYIVDTLTKKLKLNPEKVPFLASDYGNTVSSSVPLIFDSIENNANIIVVSGFGVGLSWGSVVLNKIN